MNQQHQYFHNNGNKYIAAAATSIHSKERLKVKCFELNMMIYLDDLRYT